MNAISRLLRVRLGNRPPDAWLSFWGCLAGAVAIFIGSATALWRHTSNASEFAIGLSAACGSCALLVLLGVLARRVHLAFESGQADWRARRWELVSHGMGFLVVGAGGWAVAEMAGNPTRAITGGLMVLGAYCGVLVLGCWSTLVRSRRCGASG